MIVIRLICIISSVLLVNFEIKRHTTLFLLRSLLFNFFIQSDTWICDDPGVLLIGLLVAAFDLFWCETTWLAVCFHLQRPLGLYEAMVLCLNLSIYGCAVTMDPYAFFVLLLVTEFQSVRLLILYGVWKVFRYMCPVVHVESEPAELEPPSRSIAKNIDRG